MQCRLAAYITQASRVHNALSVTGLYTNKAGTADTRRTEPSGISSWVVDGHWSSVGGLWVVSAGGCELPFAGRLRIVKETWIGSIH